MIDPLSVAAGAGILAVGMLIGHVMGRRAERHRAGRPDRPQEPFCGCGHHRALHDTEGGECHQRVNIFKGTGADTIRMQQCTCRQYVGPEPISSVWVPPAVLPSDLHLPVRS